MPFSHEEVYPYMVNPVLWENNNNNRNNKDTISGADKEQKSNALYSLLFRFVASPFFKSSLNILAVTLFQEVPSRFFRWSLVLGTATALILQRKYLK